MRALLITWKTLEGMKDSVSLDQTQLDAAIERLKEKEIIPDPQDEPVEIEVVNGPGLAEVIQTNDTVFLEEEDWEYIKFAD